MQNTQHLGLAIPLLPKGLQMFPSVLSRLKGAVSDRELSGAHCKAAQMQHAAPCCIVQGMMATCTEVGLLAQVTSAKPPKAACLLQRGELSTLGRWLSFLIQGNKQRGKKKKTSHKLKQGLLLEERCHNVF